MTYEERETDTGKRTREWVLNKLLFILPENPLTAQKDSRLAVGEYIEEEGNHRTVIN